jgi:fructose-6-phosphate aldolase 1
MFELYLDTAKLSDIKKFASIFPLHGITTNPSILASEGLGLNALLAELSTIFSPDSLIHVQVISNSVDEIISEALALRQLPYNIVVKIPADAAGLAAIKQLKQQKVPTLATAIYTVQQGIMASLCGADYLAPYLNRIDNLGYDGLGVVADLQDFINHHQLPTKLLVASFKNVQQVLQVMKLGVASVTVPIEIANQLINTPATDAAVCQFKHDWERQFANQLSFQT